ncbi:hypothetical protein IV203_025313 [Nitzschia inconspicua]|uniref:Uncharacterized protein n=1 Tax=Nitzschia inconspicua TaxID=303405 RepID=A0A9K3P9W6_9STRA|nr:hypothetical protein IV203_024681 [Nitzschia inconspicua]KAG7362429.1 hypothetical protein IV203_025313 [Nitzschia inconspicua]
MDSIRLDIDGMISQISSCDDPFYPPLELFPYSTSVLSCLSDESPVMKASKKKSGKGMSLERYNFLCWKIMIGLLLEIGILLSVLVTYNCKFYTVLLFNGKDDAFLDVGLFRFSLAGGETSNQSQCTRFSSVSMNADTAPGRWLKDMTAMLSVPRLLAILAPILAAAGCFCTALQVLERKKVCGRWSTSAILLLAGLFQGLSIISFDGQSTCNLFGVLPSSQITDCKYSTGFRMALFASIIYFALSVLVATTPEFSCNSKEGKMHDNNDNRNVSVREEENTSVSSRQSDTKDLPHISTNPETASENSSVKMLTEMPQESDDEIVLEETSLENCCVQEQVSTTQLEHVMPS